MQNIYDGVTDTEGSGLTYCKTRNLNILRIKHYFFFKDKKIVIFRATMWQKIVL